MVFSHTGFPWAKHTEGCLDPPQGEWAKLHGLDSCKAVTAWPSVLGVTEVQERSPSLLLSLVNKYQDYSGEESVAHPMLTL